MVHLGVDEAGSRRRGRHGVLLDRLQRRPEERDRRAAEPPAGARGELDEPARVRAVERKRLLGVDVLPGLERTRGDVGVELERREVEDAVDAVVRKQVVERRLQLAAPLRDKRGRTCGIDVGGRDDRQLRVRRERARVPLGHVPAADDPEPEHALVSPERGLHVGPALLAQLVEHLHGKEGVDGSSPSEGSAKAPQIRAVSFGLTCTSSRMRWVWSRLWSFQV